jgi:D-sedoheptulose 7-phosphate isomerase
MVPNHKFELMVRERIEENTAVTRALLDDHSLIALVVDVAHDLATVLRENRCIYLAGNGGSAADAQHIAAELVGEYKIQRRALPVHALTVNTSSLTAIANDHGFETVFARQLEAVGSTGDVVIAISTSGNSRNLLQAVRVAKEQGMMSIGMTGREGGELKRIVDRCICVPSEETPRVQEAHILIGHLLCEMIEAELFGT